MTFIPSALQAMVAFAGLWLALLWLWSRRCNNARVGTAAKTLAGAATVLLLFVPLNGSPLWNRAFSFYPNPSLPMLGIVCAALWQQLFGLTVFQRNDWRAIWMFGGVTGSALYLHSLILDGIDLYYWGWERVFAAWMLAAVAVGFLATGNRLGVLLLAALAAFACTALESQNCWDYAIDPLYWLTSMGMLAIRAASAGIHRGRASCN